MPRSSDNFTLHESDDDSVKSKHKKRKFHFINSFFLHYEEKNDPNLFQSKFTLGTPGQGRDTIILDTSYYEMSDGEGVEDGDENER